MSASATACTAARQHPSSSPSPEVCPNSCPLHWWCHPAISSSDVLFLLPSVFPSIRDFSNELSVHIRWPKYWSFSFSISASSEYSGLISLKIDWFDLLAVQSTLKNLLQHLGLKASIFLHFAFFTVQLSQLYMTTWKTIALIIYAFIGRVMSLLFNILSRFISFPAKKQSSSDYMTAVTIHSDLRAHEEEENLSLLPPLSPLFAMK